MSDRADLLPASLTILSFAVGALRRADDNTRMEYADIKNRPWMPAVLLRSVIVSSGPPMLNQITLALSFYGRYWLMRPFGEADKEPDAAP